MFRLALFLTFFSFSALAEDDFLILRDVSQNHCQLLQSAPLKPSPTMGKRIEELTQTPDEFSLQTQYEHAPNFDFLLSDYWQVMSWAQRVRFNHGITALIKQRLKIPQQEVVAGDCEPQIRIIEHPNQEIDIADDTPLPRPLRYRAIILMEIRGENERPTPLTYFYQKDWNIGWKAEDILIHNNSIKERDSKALENIIQINGLNALEGYLEQLLAEFSEKRE